MRHAAVSHYICGVAHPHDLPVRSGFPSDMKSGLHALLSLLLLLSSGCGPQAYEASPPPDRAVVLPGLRLEAPADERWTIVEHGAHLIALSRATPEITAMLSARVLPADQSGDDAAFVRKAEADREAEVSALEMLSVHYSGTALNGATCLAFDGLYRDPHADPARQFHTRKGYVCLHPELRTQAVRLEITFDAGSKRPLDAESLLRVADTFFNSVSFTKPAGAD
jgi:hypothetical protein